MEMQYVKRKGDFGKPYTFMNSETELLVNISPDKIYSTEYILKDPVHKTIQCGPQYAEFEVNTVQVSHENHGMNHAEGGWPKDINPADPEQTVRFKKKIEKDDMYTHSIHQLSHTMEHCILQNNAINIYELYFEEEDEEDIIPVFESLSYRTVNVFRDPCNVKRPIQYLSWSPDGGSHVAASYCNLDFQYTFRNQQMQSYIWEIENPNKPGITLKPTIPIVCIEYNPKDAHSLLSGLYSGQVAIWDIRKGYDPAEISSPECSHRDPAFHTLWINSKTGTEFFSSSPDGQLKWWDIRKLTEPLETLIVDIIKGETQQITRAHGVSVLEYEHSIPIRFMVGTETGLVVSGNRKGKTASEKLTAQYKVHQGPVCSLQRNPSFVKIFLTVGDWTAKIWSEDCKESAIMWTNYHRSRLTSGAWSPTRYSVFFTTKMDGSLDVWDILQKQKEPCLSVQVAVQVCDKPLRCIKCHENGQLVAVANDSGSLYLLQFSQNLANSAKNDKTLLTSIFERESRREKIIESKMKEIRLKSKVGKVIDTHLAMKDTTKSAVAMNMDQTYIQAAENEFFSTIDELNELTVVSGRNFFFLSL